MVPDAGGLRMIRFAAAASAAATCLLLATSSGPVAAPDSRALPMQFDTWTEGPAQACSNDCRTWVSASGAITADTPKDFDAFAKKNKIDGATIALDSDGGSVLGALALGRSIRKLGMTTKVDTAGGEAPEVNSGTATNSAALANGARAAVNAHGWAVVALDGRPALGRSHPLTVEGDDVGAFELNFACGEQGRDYIVTYVEQRRGNDAARVPAALSEVEVSFSGKPTQLNVVASRPRDKSTELVSIASGRISVEALKAFAET